MRIYFNRMADLPRIWSFDLGTQETERTVVGWKLHGAAARDGHDFEVEPGDKERPRVWIEVTAMDFQVIDGVLHVYGGGLDG